MIHRYPIQFQQRKHPAKLNSQLLTPKSDPRPLSFPLDINHYNDDDFKIGFQSCPNHLDIILTLLCVYTVYTHMSNIDIQMDVGQNGRPRGPQMLV